MKKFLYITCSALFILLGAYYLIAEFICITATCSQFTAYFKNTISDLCVPYSLTGFSYNYKLMVSAFLIVAPAFFISYNYLFFSHLKRCKLICFIFSAFMLIGLIIVGIFNCEKDVTLHFIGAFITFSSCNILVLLTIINSDIFTNSLRKIAIVNSVFGIIASVFTISLKHTFLFPVFERLTVYPVIIFSITTGILFLSRLKSNNNFNYVSEKII